MVWRRNVRLLCIQEEGKCRDTNTELKWKSMVYQTHPTHLQHSYRFSKVCSFRYIFLCFYWLVFISLRKPRNNRYFSAIYLTILQIWCISKILLSWVAMCEKKLRKKKKRRYRQKNGSFISSIPQTAQTCQEDRGEEAVCFLQPRENLKECWRKLLFLSDWVKKIPNRLQNK